jgi:hypothetical protein
MAGPSETRLSRHFSGTAAKSYILPFRVLDLSLTVCGSVYMNERPKLGSAQIGLIV